MVSKNSPAASPKPGSRPVTQTRAREATEWFEASDKCELDESLTAPSSPMIVKLTVKASRDLSTPCPSWGSPTHAPPCPTPPNVLSNAPPGTTGVLVWVSLSLTTSRIGTYADGAIVGTALVAALRDGGPEAVGELTRHLVSGATKD